MSFGRFCLGVVPFAAVVAVMVVAHYALVVFAGWGPVKAILVIMAAFVGIVLVGNLFDKSPLPPDGKQE